MKTNSMSYPKIDRSNGYLLFPYNITHNEAVPGEFSKPESYDYDIVLIPETEDAVTNYTNVVQALLDTTANSRGYSGIISGCTYATSTDAIFSKEGQSLVEWRDAVWRKCYEILALVQQQLRNSPTMDELLSELPTIVWP
jgi:hypothetical protein